jgi:hypothetical protein
MRQQPPSIFEMVSYDLPTSKHLLYFNSL